MEVSGNIYGRSELRDERESRRKGERSGGELEHAVFVAPFMRVHYKDRCWMPLD